MQTPDFAEEYKLKSDDELLRLALDADQLTDDAKRALSSERLARGIHNPERMAVFREQEEDRKEEEARDTGTLWFLPSYGIGRKRFCKGQYELSESGVEQFVTTVFIVLFWLPLFPTGTYRVLKKRDEPLVVLEKLPLEWEQVLLVWVVTAGSVLLLIWAFKIWHHLMFR